VYYLNFRVWLFLLSVALLSYGSRVIVACGTPFISCFIHHSINMWRYNEVATGILYVLPELAALVVFLQLVSLSNAYRGQIRALRHGDQPFNRHERSNELPSAASEW